MSKFITILTSMFLFTPAYSGTFEGGGGPTKELSIYKEVSGKRELPNRQLNLVLRNHMFKAKVQKHPSSKIKLFDACINGDIVESISKAPRTHCVDWIETDAVKHGNSIKELTCRKWSRSMSYRNAVKYAKRNPKECKLILGSQHPNKNLYGSRPNEMVPFCDYKQKINKLPITQRVEIFDMKESRPGSIYFHPTDEDSAQPGSFRYKYTLPKCN